MTAMDAQTSPQPSDSVPNCAPPPVPPPPPGCPGSLQLPDWRSEPPPSHFAPTKEEIEKEQYAHLPDKLLNSMNKDKKPFTYTPSGVSGLEKGKLDLSSIRSPKMRKRLLANLADDEDSDQFESERVTRSETPEVTNKHKLANGNTRRAMTPDMSLNRGMYAPVLPPIEMLKERPVVPKYKSEEQLDAYVKKQMNEMENSLKKNEFNELEPEVKELINSYKNVQNQHNIPIQVEESLIQPEQKPFQPEPRQIQPEQKPYQPEPRQIQPEQKPTQPEQRQVVVEHEYTSPESTKPVEQTMSYNLDYNRNPINVSKDRNNGIITNSRDRNHRNDSKREKDFNKNTNNYYNSSNPWDSDLLRHVLDGGLQEEIEKFEQISLETQHSFNPKRNDYFERETTPTFDTFGRSLPNPSPVWSPYGSSYQDSSYASLNQTPSPYGSLNRGGINRNGIKSPQPFQSSQPFQSQQQSIVNARQFWSESPSPSPHHYYERETASVEPPVYQGVNIPSNQQRTGFTPSEAPNYNCRPRPFYLCSPTPTPTPTPPPPAQFTQQPIQRPKEQQFTTFGYKNIAPQKISYQNEFSNTGMNSKPQTKYIDSIGMYAQTTTPEGWDRPTSPPTHRSMEKNITFSEHIITTPERTGIKSPEPPKPILKKKLPPSERPPDPTPPKYMGANIPSRSFRVLQLMTGENIDNQFIGNDNGFETKTAPKSRQFNKTVSYSNYDNFETDF